MALNRNFIFTVRSIRDYDKKVPPKSVTMRDLGRELGLSAYSISLALRNSPEISSATRKRVRETARRLGYRRDPLLSTAMSRMRNRGGKSQQGAIGVIFSGPRGRFEQEAAPQALFQGVQRQAAEFGFQTDLFLPDADYVNQRERMAEVIRSRGLPGLILCAVTSTFEMMEKGESSIDLLMGDSPMVLVGFLSAGLQPHWHIGEDRVWEIAEITRHAIEQGYRRPGLIWYPSVSGILEGHIDGAFATLITDLLGSSHLIPRLATSANHPDRLRAWLEEHRPDCVISNSAATMRDLKACGVRIPEDLGFASTQPDPSIPGLSCVDPHWEEMGRMAMSTLAATLQRHALGLPSLPGRMLLKGDWQKGETLPAREPRAVRPNCEHALRFTSVDLQPVLNHPVNETGGWFGRQPLQGLPVGKFLGAGVPIQIGVWKPSAPACLLMRSGTLQAGVDGKRLPERKRIEIRRTVMAIWILHACGNSRPGEKFAEYQVKLPGAKSRVVPIVALGEIGFINSLPERRARLQRANIQDWWRTYEPLEKPGVSPVILSSALNPNYLRRLYLLEIAFKTPQQVEAVEVTSLPTANSTLAILGMTVEEVME